MIDEWGKGAKYWDKPWNPMIGCKPVSEGCENCYAEEVCYRFPDLHAKGSMMAFDPHLGTKANPPRKGVVFVGNMTDIFGEWNTDKQIVAWLDRLSPDAVNLVLTKRAERLTSILYKLNGKAKTWFGVTAENQKRLEERLPALFSAHRRWLSLEPLLGAIDFREAMAVCNDIGDDFQGVVDWVVVGAESGPDRRPCKLEWVRSIVRQCQAADIPVFVKQLDLDGKLEKDINKFPADLQIRQVPWEVSK